MNNLYALNTETLVKIITDLDMEVSILDKKLHESMSYEAMGSAEIGDLQIMLDKAYRDYVEMNKTRQYWKNKYLELKEKYEPSVKRKITEPKKKKEFKINLKGERTLNKLQNRKYKDEPELEIEVNEEKVYTPKNTYTHSVESTKGNIAKSKHSGHKTNNEVLVGIFPKGEVKEFDSVNDAKDYIRENYKEFKSSPLTNISRAARQSGFYANNGGMAYNVKWSYKNKEIETVDGLQIIKEN